MKLPPTLSARCNTLTKTITPAQFRKVVLVLMVLLFAFTAFQRAWASDDAYITFRTVDNFVSGYRLTWNVTERVQAYTHPLWMFLLSAVYFFTREIYLSSIFTSLVVSTIAVSLYAYAFRNQFWRTFSGLLALTFSNAFIDYSTSGLENPLSHLLLVIFLIILQQAKAGNWKWVLLSAVASLAAVNRHDTFLIYLPLLAGLFFEKPGLIRLLLLAAGQLPLIAWEIFSLFYYGFLFPNTAYAKLNTGIPAVELLRQGLNYYLDSLARDPLTLIVTASALVAVVLFRGRIQRLLGAGLILYLMYVLRIGGDFMSGRFFSVVLLGAVLLWALVNLKVKNRWVEPAFTLALLAIIITAPVSTLQQKLPKGVPVSSSLGVTDERAWYYDGLSLWHNGIFQREPGTMGRDEGMKARANAGTDLLVTPANHIGVMGYYAGPSVYIIDQYALADALLARLPAVREIDWYSGHFKRILPEGYMSTIYTGTSQLTDEGLSAYYEALQLATQAPLLSPGRFSAIINLNLGRFDTLIDRDAYRYPDQIEIAHSADDMTMVQGAGFTYDTAFGEHGILLHFPQTVTGEHWKIALSDGIHFRLFFYSGAELVQSVVLTGAEGSSAALFELSGKAEPFGVDSLRILPETPANTYQLYLISIN